MKTTLKKTLSNIMVQAWHFIKNNGCSKSEALRLAWRNAKLHAAMILGAINFSFVKVDGTIRNAVGTLCGNLIPNYNASGESRTNGNVQVYYDLEANAFRSYRKINLV